MCGSTVSLRPTPGGAGEVAEHACTGFRGWGLSQSGAAGLRGLPRRQDRRLHREVAPAQRPAFSPCEKAPARSIPARSIPAGVKRGWEAPVSKLSSLPGRWGDAGLSCDAPTLQARAEGLAKQTLRQASRAWCGPSREGASADDHLCGCHSS